MTGVFLWRAGTAEGVVGDFAVAQVRAACVICTGGPRTAVVEQAVFVGGGASMDSRYLLLGWRWTGRRRPDGGVCWQRQRPPVPAGAAAWPR